MQRLQSWFTTSESPTNNVTTRTPNRYARSRPNRHRMNTRKGSTGETRNKRILVGYEKQAHYFTNLRLLSLPQSTENIVLAIPRKGKEKIPSFLVPWACGSGPRAPSRSSYGPVQRGPGSGTFPALYRDWLARESVVKMERSVFHQVKAQTLESLSRILSGRLSPISSSLHHRYELIVTDTPVLKDDI